jgi:hypothetical protein
MPILGTTHIKQPALSLDLFMQMNEASKSEDINAQVLRLAHQEGKAVRHVSTSKLKEALEGLGLKLSKAYMASEPEDDGGIEFQLVLTFETAEGLKRTNTELLDAVHELTAPAKVKWADVDGETVTLRIKGFITLDK